MKISPFIEEGKAYERFIAGNGGLPNVWLSVRICNRLDQVNWRKKAGALEQRDDDAGAFRFTAEFMAARIEKWSLPFNPSPANIAGLHPVLYNRVLDIVLSHDGGDFPIPPESEAQQDGDTMLVQETAAT